MCWATSVIANYANREMALGIELMEIGMMAMYQVPS
jgi:hypothetical protein